MQDKILDDPELVVWVKRARKLHDEGGLSWSEVARTLNVSRGCLQKRLKRAEGLVVSRLLREQE